MTGYEPTYYVECTACDWRKEFTSGALRSETELPESGKKRLAGHMSNNPCTADDHEQGWCDPPDVLEAKVTVDLTMHFAPEKGERLADEIEEVLMMGPCVRYVDGMDIDQAYQTEEY